MRRRRGHRPRRRNRELGRALAGALALFGTLAISFADPHGSADARRSGALVTDAPVTDAPVTDAPVIARFVAEPSVLPAAGGRVAIVSVVRGAKTCRLVSPGGRLHLPEGGRCHRGTSQATVRIPANEADAVRTFRIDLAVASARLSRRRALVVRVRAARAETASGAPLVVSEPLSETAPPGAVADFSALASATPPPTVRWEVSADSGRTWSAIAGATASSYEVAVTAGLNGDEYRAVFANSRGSATSAPAQLVVGDQTANWAGYVLPGTAMSAVSGTLTVPSLICTGAHTEMSLWVGIDGFAPTVTVEQDGIAASCAGGIARYQAWYEMYGDAAANNGYERPLPVGDAVHPGDSVSASVSVDDGVWTLALSDATQGWAFSIQPPRSAAFSPAENSAEWIVERPESCTSSSASSCSYVPLADFGTASVSDPSATLGGVSGSIDPSETVSDLEMTDPGPGAPLARASALAPDGAGFKVSWAASGAEEHAR